MLEESYNIQQAKKVFVIINYGTVFSLAFVGLSVFYREKQIRGSGGSAEPPGPPLEPPGPPLMHLHTVYMAYSECLPTRVNPLAERTCFSQVAPRGDWRSHGW